MDSVLLSSHSRTLDGLRDMMRAADDADELVQTYVEVSTALLIVEAAKRAPDRPEWFPAGKWATIQNIQQSIEEQLGQLFRQ
jgi:hypothetical protein